MRITVTFTGIKAFSILSFIFLASCVPSEGPVGSVSQQISAIPHFVIADAEKFLNDLKLSPYWKVEKNRAGDFEAHARSIFPEGWSDSADRQFLFEQFSQKTIRLPNDWRIRNDYIEGGLSGRNATFVSFSATIVFRKPTNPGICVLDEHGFVVLTSHGRSDNPMNSGSTLALRLGTDKEIYLLVREQGADVGRTATFAKLPSLLQEIGRIIGLPERYRVLEQYRALFETLFTCPLKETALKRQAGIQGIDTFYGCFEVQPATSYEGINIRISHPIYCNGECTSEPDRLRRAEYLGKPYYDDDTVFFLIEDNTVGVLGDYYKQFGVFSGKNTFEGTLEVLNGSGEVLYTTKDQFTAWER